MSGVAPCASCGKKNRVPATAKGTPRCAQCKADLPWLVDADDGTFAAVTSTNVPVLVDLWAPWCGPCRMVAPGVERASKEFAGRLKVVKVNVDEAPQVSRRFAVQSIPMLVLLHHGKVVSQQVGALPQDRLLAWVRSAAPTVVA
jgi:thioredoxin 2